MGINAVARVMEFQFIRNVKIQITNQIDYFVVFAYFTDKKKQEERRKVTNIFCWIISDMIKL